MIQQQGLLSVPLLHRQVASMEYYALLNGGACLADRHFYRGDSLRNICRANLVLTFIRGYLLMIHT